MKDLELIRTILVSSFPKYKVIIDESIELIKENDNTGIIFLETILNKHVNLVNIQSIKDIIKKMEIIKNSKHT